MESDKIHFDVNYVLIRIINFALKTSKEIIKIIENDFYFNLSQLVLSNLKTEKCEDLIQGEILLFLGDFVRKYLDNTDLQDKWLAAVSHAWTSIVLRHRSEITTEEIMGIFPLRSSTYLYLSEHAGLTIEEMIEETLKYKTEVIIEIVENNKLSFYSPVPDTVLSQSKYKHNFVSKSGLVAPVKIAIAAAFEQRFDILFNDIQFS